MIYYLKETHQERHQVAASNDGKVETEDDRDAKDCRGNQVLFVTCHLFNVGHGAVQEGKGEYQTDHGQSEEHGELLR